MINKVKYVFLLSFSLIFIYKTSFTQTIVEGVKFNNNLKAGENILVLNGAGLREKYFLNLYVAGLYLKTKSQDADKIMAVDEPMAII